MGMLMSVVLSTLFAQVVYAPSWESLDARPNPAWFEEAKFGVFIVWGVYSVPAWGPKDRYAEWYGHDMRDADGPTGRFHAKTYGASFQYQDFAPMFRAELFDPDQWADVIARSGARYVVHTAKFHDGFSLWPDPNNGNWNSMDVGPHRDLVGEVHAAMRKRGLRVGCYYSLYEWHNPLYRADVHRYVDQYMLPQMKDLVERYQPDLFWPDGEWDHRSSTWRSTEFLAWLFNDSSAPRDIAVNDRWGKDCRSRHGGFATPEYQHRQPGPLMESGFFEECQGMGKSFGYNRNESAEDYRSATELIHLLIDTVSRGGNLLLDVGPSADGRIPDIMQQRLLDIGAWLKVNGESIYGTEACGDMPALDTVRFTRKGPVRYALCLAWPGEKLALPRISGLSNPEAVMLGVDGPLASEWTESELIIHVPCLPGASLPCPHAWVFRIQEKS